MCKNAPTKGRPWSERRNGERQPFSMQCDSVLHDMYHQHANFLVALNCGGYFPRTSTKTRLFLFSSKQPLQGIYIYIYLCIYRIISQIWLLYIFVAWFFVQVFLDHIHLLFCEPTSTHTDEHSHFNRLPQNLCDATTTLRVVHIILHNCKFISPPTPPGWNIYQVAEASFVIHLCDLLARTWGDRWLTVVNSWDTQMETLYFWKPKL